MQEKPINSAHESPFHSEMIENFDQLDQQTALSLRDVREFRSTRPANRPFTPRCSRISINSAHELSYHPELIEKIEHLASKIAFSGRVNRILRATRSATTAFSPRCPKKSINSTHKPPFHSEMFENFDQLGPRTVISSRVDREIRTSANPGNLRPVSP